MSPALFTPINVGDVTLQHRIVLCPLTRNRANDQHIHTDLATEYYSQRASEPGTLLITEGTFIAPQAGGYENVPGCYNDEQIAAWKKIVDAVHAKGSYIYMQLWALGRAATAETLRAEGDYDVVSASDIPRLSGSDIPLDHERDTKGRDRPRPLTVEDIKEYVALYAQAAKNFVFGAGGDGVEIHGANGYLVDQFTQNVSNVRTDTYGGSVENRARFCLDAVGAVTAAVGERRVGLRLSPFSTFQDMRMADPDIIETFTYLVTELKNRHPNMAYLHAGEPRVGGGNDLVAAEGDSLEFLHKIWTHQPMIVAGSYTPETARSEAEARPNALIGFGRHFIANPDLPRRIREGIQLNMYNRETFYLKGYQPTGYTDYPFAK